MNTEDIFRNTRFNNVAETRSGSGSMIAATAVIRKLLPKVIGDFGIRSILDIPCGDFNWMKEVDLSNIIYIGADVVSDIIAENTKKYHRDFRHLDLITDDLPKVALVFCRDCLVHFSYGDVSRALRNIAKSGSRYLLMTTFTKKQINIPQATGDWRPYNFQKPPFSLQPPELIINENCQESYPLFTDKSLGLWEIEKLDRSL